MRRWETKEIVVAIEVLICHGCDATARTEPATIVHRRDYHQTGALGATEYVGEGFSFPDGWHSLWDGLWACPSCCDRIAELLNAISERARKS